MWPFAPPLAHLHHHELRNFAQTAVLKVGQVFDDAPAGLPRLADCVGALSSQRGIACGMEALERSRGVLDQLPARRKQVVDVRVHALYYVFHVLHVRHAEGAEAHEVHAANAWLSRRPRARRARMRAGVRSGVRAPRSLHVGGAPSPTVAVCGGQACTRQRCEHTQSKLPPGRPQIASRMCTAAI